MSMFKKAERSKVKLRMAITGVAGSGKTLGALLIAKGLGGKIALLDTENETSALYSDKIDFDICPMMPPYTVERYIKVISDAEESGYETLIIDSLSHAWAGEGGLLEQVEKITSASKSKNSYVAWGKATPMQNRLISKIMNSKINIIVTMRSKVAYELVKNSNGNSIPSKMGMAPVQREGMDYEFNLVLDLSTEENLATVTKKRGSLFEMGQIFKITEETGSRIKEWMLEGKEPENKIDLSSINNSKTEEEAIHNARLLYQQYKNTDNDQAKELIILTKDMKVQSLKEESEKLKQLEYDEELSG